MDYSDNDLIVLDDKRRTQGFGVALTVHDLIPIYAPQFTTLDLESYFTDLLLASDPVVLVISETTGQDLRRFENDRGLPHRELVKIPLGSTLADLEPRQPARMLSEGPVDFILAVGTVNIRKNHHLLLDVWEMMLRESHPSSPPKLVIAGARGVFSEETMARIERTPELRDSVIHIASGSDEEIAWLYRNCLFTVYPSFYEGWGLPVSESHDFAKVCLTSNVSSLPEAGSGLAQLLDPYDRKAWKDEIVLLATDNGYRTDLEETIRSRHQRTTAADTANALVGLCTADRRGEIAGAVPS